MLLDINFAMVSCRHAVVNIHTALMQIFFLTYNKTIAINLISIPMEIICINDTV